MKRWAEELSEVVGAEGELSPEVLVLGEALMVVSEKYGRRPVLNKVTLMLGAGETVGGIKFYPENYRGVTDDSFEEGR